jgi:DNA mismatch endonuclease (patch repair protein)
MADIVDRATRSRMMSGIRSKDTKPELRARRYLHAKGLRFRLHAKELPGKPDLVFPLHHTVLQIHGCFFHHHPNCRFAYMPKSNRAFWRRKLLGNVERDGLTTRALRRLGWRVLVLWECQTDERHLAAIYKRIKTSTSGTK